jgi:general secretion pathway protein G
MDTQGFGCHMPAIRKQAGSTLLELMVMGSIIGILALVLLDRTLRYQEVAEKTVMETTFFNMRTGLHLRMAELMIKNRMQDMGLVARENPINWLEAPPPNYIGEIDKPDPEQIPLGSWYYDSGRRQLVYVPERTRHLRPGPGGEKVIRYQVTSTTRPDQGEGAPKVEGVTLAPVIPYDWPVF